MLSLKESITKSEIREGRRCLKSRRALNEAILKGGKGDVDTIIMTCNVCSQGKSCDGSTKDTGVTGSVTFSQRRGESCNISWIIQGLAKGLHGFHIHEKSDFSDGCKSAGPHFNPFGKSHGGPDDEERHVGDLGNIEANEEGVAEGSMSDPLIKLDGEHSILMRSVMIHADEDDLGRGGDEESKITGNAGARLACGCITLHKVTCV